MRNIVARALVLVGAFSGHFANAQDDDPTAKYGSLSGTIIVSGARPDPVAIVVNRDHAVCSPEGKTIFDQSLKIGPNNELQDVYVMLVLKPREKITDRIHPDLRVPSETAVFEISGCQFTTPAMIVRTGQTIRIKNDDPIGHSPNVASFFNASSLSFPPSSEIEWQFENADKVPSSVRCDIHPWMRATLLVRRDPYAALTDQEGKFLIEKIPAGQWSFQFWHSRFGYMNDLQKEGTSFVGRRGIAECEITNGETLDLGELKIDLKALAEKQ